MLLSARGVPGEDFMAALSSFAEDAAPTAIVVTGWPLFDWIPELTPAVWSIGASPQAAAAVARVLDRGIDPRCAAGRPAAGSRPGLVLSHWHKSGWGAFSRLTMPPSSANLRFWNERRGALLLLPGS